MADYVEMATNEGMPCRLLVYEELLILEHSVDYIFSNLKYLEDLEYKDEDILLVSYPKSGNHLINALIRELRKKSPDEPEQQSVFLLEAAKDAKSDTQQQTARHMSTHFRPNRIRSNLLNEKCKVVLVIRNPKDIVVSFYYQLKHSAVIAHKQTWDEYFTSTLQGVVPFGSYFDFLDDCEHAIKEAKNSDGCCNIEVFQFEDLKKNPLENVRRLSKHLGMDKSDDELQRVVEACSIERLREKANISDKERSRLDLRGKDGNSIIYRKGDVGDWKNHFTVAQNEAFDKLIETRLKDSMFKFKYEL